LLDVRTAYKSKSQIGAHSVDVIVAPRGGSGKKGSEGGMLKHFFQGLLSLLKGMKVTLSYLVRPSTVITQQYPENRKTLKMFDRYKGQLKLIYDEDGHYNCNGCQFCEIACPNASIIITPRKDPVTEKLELDRFIWRMDSCTFCNACVQVCPHDTLEWSTDFENAVYDRRLLVFSLNKYAGPPKKAIKRAEKKGQDIKPLMDSFEDRGVYEGKVPMSGTPLAGVLNLKKESSDPQRENIARLPKNSDSKKREGEGSERRSDSLIYRLF